MAIDAGDRAAGDDLQLENAFLGGAGRQVSTETLDNRGHRGTLGRMALGLAAVALFVFVARGQGDADGTLATPDPAATDRTGNQARDADDPFPTRSDDAAQADELFGSDRSTVGGTPDQPSGRSAPKFRAWPDPPEDHDPHIAGRPGPQEPVRDDLIGFSLVYVNDRGRPTVIDLTTGDQRELDIAGPRQRDRFLVEFGRIVVEPSSNDDLPKSSGRAFEFTVERSAIPSLLDDETADGPSTRTLTGPTLCLDEGGCPGAALLTGTFGDDRDRLTSVVGDDGPAAVLAQVLGSTWWSKVDRWTVFALTDDGEGEGEELRVPTPMTSTVVWLIRQTPT